MKSEGFPNEVSSNKGHENALNFLIVKLELVVFFLNLKKNFLRIELNLYNLTFFFLFAVFVQKNTVRGNIFTKIRTTYSSSTRFVFRHSFSSSFFFFGGERNGCCFLF